MRPFVIRCGNHFRARVAGVIGRVWSSRRDCAEVYTTMPAGGPWTIEFVEQEPSRHGVIDLVLR